MHHELIKAHIRICGTTPAAIADELGVTRTAVAHAINGKSKSARIRAHIAMLIDKPQATLWPPEAKAAPGVRRRTLPKVARDKFGFPLDALLIGSPEAAAHEEKRRAARKLARKEASAEVGGAAA